MKDLPKFSRKLLYQERKRDKVLGGKYFSGELPVVKEKPKKTETQRTNTSIKFKGIGQIPFDWSATPIFFKLKKWKLKSLKDIKKQILEQKKVVFPNKNIEKEVWENFKIVSENLQIYTWVELDHYENFFKKRRGKEVKNEKEVVEAIFDKAILTLRFHMATLGLLEPCKRIEHQYEIEKVSILLTLKA